MFAAYVSLNRQARKVEASAIILCFEGKLCIAKTVDTNLTTTQFTAPRAA